MMQAVLADLFGVAEHRVRVIAPDVGGSFGIKIHVYQDDLAAVALALTLGRPVKWVASRRESFLSDIHAREQVIEIEVGGRRRRRVCAACGRASPPRWGRTRRIRAPASSRAARSCACCPGPIASGTTRRTLRVVAQHKVDHLAVPGRRPSDRRCGDREHAGSDRAGPGARSRRDPAAQPGAARADAVDVADGQRLRQRVVSRGARPPAARRPATRRSGAEQARQRARGPSPRHRPGVLHRADRARRAVLRRRRRADLRPGRRRRCAWSRRGR